MFKLRQNYSKCYIDWSKNFKKSHFFTFQSNLRKIHYIQFSTFNENLHIFDKILAIISKNFHLVFCDILNNFYEI